jgi:hypothetical protein
VGRWRDEMSANTRRFAALHLADYLREHGYEGAQDAAGEVALLPIGDAVGPNNELLLLDLARRGLVVVRPAPATPMAQHQNAHLVFVGVKGQLDPTRGQPALRRLVGQGMLGLGLLGRRLQGRPILWLRQATLWPRRPRDPGEHVLPLLLRPLAREVTMTDIPKLVDDPDSEA